MDVTIVRDVPVTPPIIAVEVELTPPEAKHLRHILAYYMLMHNTADRFSTCSAFGIDLNDRLMREGVMA